MKTKGLERETEMLEANDKEENLNVEGRKQEGIGRLSLAVRRRNYSFVQKSGVWDKLKKQYENGYISSLAELSAKIKEQTGVHISAMTLSRRLRSPDKGLIRKRRYLTSNVDQGEFGKDKTDAPSSSVGECYRSLSRRLCATMMNVAEGGGIRQYTRTRVSSDGLKEYFRCNRCYFQKCKTGGGIVATIAAYKGNLIGNKHPKHHEKCELIGVECAAVTAVDRKSRLEVRTGHKEPKEAHNEAFERTVQLASSLSAPSGRKLSMTTMFPSWQRVRKSYYRHKRNGLGDASVHNAESRLDGNILNENLFVKEDQKTDANNDDEIVDVVGLLPQQLLLKPQRNSSPVKMTTQQPVRYSHSDDCGYYKDSSENANVDEQTEVYNGSDIKEQWSLNGVGSDLSPPSASKILSGRHHYVIRNPLTGRIIVCNSSRRRICKNNKNSFTERIYAQRSYDDNQLNNDRLAADREMLDIKPRHNTCRGQKKISSGCGPSMNFKTKSEILEGNEEGFCCSRTDSGNVERADVQMLFDKQNNDSQCDHFHRMGESIADSLRGVYEVDAEAAARFQSELFEVMAKYEKAVIGKLS